MKDLIRDQKRRENAISNGINAISFFSGAMGMDIGLEKSGINILLACEMNKFCRKTIKTNKPDIGLIGDIWKYDISEIIDYAHLRNHQEIDLIVGGPPCQAFSTAGHRKGLEDQRGNALLRYIEIIEQIQPTYMVLENVRGLLSASIPGELPGSIINYIITRLQNIGYGVSFNLYNSANYGTPQIRERVIIIAHKGGDELPYLVPTHSQNNLYDLPKWKTFKDAVYGLKSDEQDYINFPEKRIKYYKMLTSGQNWKNLPINLQKEALGNAFYSGGGKTGFLRRLDWDKPSPTLLTNPTMPATDLAHPTENRPLSIQEYKRLQEFPDDWIICGPIKEQYRQIGNAVPIGLGQAIGSLLMQHKYNEPIIEYPNFPYSRYKIK